MDEEVQLKNIKEFLLNYNKISDDCFSQCVYTMSHSRLTDDEISCARNCVQKAKFVEQKCMQAFIEHQQQSMQKFMEEASKKQTEEEIILDSNTSVIENNEIVQEQSIETKD